MTRKLYALLILIGTLWALILVYLYFFVYYTATLTVNANVSDYRVVLFASSTAQKWVHECPESECVIANVSPFDYNISIIKQGYETKIISAKIWARGRESLVLELEKKVFLDAFIDESLEETAQQKIQRLRDEKSSYARFSLGTQRSISFTENDNELLLEYIVEGKTYPIQNFQRVKQDDISVSSIPSSEDVFISLWENNFILLTWEGKVHPLSFKIPINYIKAGQKQWSYQIVTNKGTFLYNISSWNSEFQYLFRDFVSFGNDIIWIIYDDEDQKKQNFNFTEKWNLIIKFSQKDKTRKLLKTTNLDIDKIEWRDNKIILSVWDSEYELKNF